jgi:molybdopterin synthase catalytic subunit
MFELTREPIDAPALARRLSSPAAGAQVTFTGTVRQSNRGRDVVRLEYEAAPELAGSEFAKIADEAQRTFEVTDMLCVHRIGAIEVGAAAVWIGVAAPHRKDAFRACQFLIDQLKLRLPVWKKEFYADGESTWIDGA